MARLNVSIPDDLAPLVSKWRRKINLSEICAQALRAELTAVESHRSAAAIVTKIRRTRGKLEQELNDRYGLVDTIVSKDSVDDGRDLRDSLGNLTAEYLNQRLSDGAVLAMAGGRQSWCVVEHLGPRQLDITIVALGYRQNDPHVLNAHPNTLATMLWMLFSPRATARLIGQDPQEVLDPTSPVEPYARYFVVGSCAPFQLDSPFAKLLGERNSSMLTSRGASSDFLYNFFDDNGRLLDLEVPEERSVLSPEHLASLSQRPDTRVLLVAGGRDKREAIRFTLEAKLCNVLITDVATAQTLV